MNFKWIALVLVLIGVGGGGYYYQFLRSPFPELEIPDLDSNHAAGKVDRLDNGKAFSLLLSDKESEKSNLDFQALKLGDSFFFDTVFKVPKGTYLQLMTVGNWILGMDSDAESTFTDARTNERGDQHTVFWSVKQGGFRALPHTYAKDDHWMILDAPMVQLIIHQAEFSLSVPNLEHAQIYVRSGEITAVWRDGRKKKILNNNLVHL